MPRQIEVTLERILYSERWGRPLPRALRGGDNPSKPELKPDHDEASEDHSDLGKSQSVVNGN